MEQAYSSQQAEATTATKQQPSRHDASHPASPTLARNPLWAQLTYGNRLPPSLRLSPEPVLRKQNTTGLPDTLKMGIENLSGLSMDDVHVHYQSSKPAQVQALAYTQGTDIHVAPGQEQHLAHEAWHVVQQKEGRVRATMQMKSALLNDDVRLESEADAMGKQALDGTVTASPQQLTQAPAELQACGCPASPIIQRVKVVEELDVPAVVTIGENNFPYTIGHSMAALQTREQALRGEYQIEPRSLSKNFPRVEGPNNVVPELRIVVFNQQGQHRQIAARFLDQESGEYVMFRSRYDRGLVIPERQEQKEQEEIVKEGKQEVKAEQKQLEVKPSGALTLRTTEVKVPAYIPGSAQAVTERFVPSGAASFFYSEEDSSSALYQQAYRNYTIEHEGPYREAMGVKSSSPMGYHHSEQSFFKMLNTQPQVVHQALRAAQLAAIDTGDPFFSVGGLTVVAISVDLFSTRAECENCQLGSKSLFAPGMFFDLAQQYLSKPNQELEQAPAFKDLTPAELEKLSLKQIERRQGAGNQQGPQYSVLDKPIKLVRVGADFYHTDLSNEKNPAPLDPENRGLLLAQPGAVHASKANTPGSGEGAVILVNVPINVNWDIARPEGARGDTNPMRTAARRFLNLQLEQKQNVTEELKQKWLKDQFSKSLNNDIGKVLLFAYYLFDLMEETQPAGLIRRLKTATSLLFKTPQQFAVAILHHYRALDLSVKDACDALITVCASSPEDIVEWKAIVSKEIGQQAAQTLEANVRKVAGSRRPFELTGDEVAAFALSLAFDEETSADIEAFGISEGEIRDSLMKQGETIATGIKAEALKRWNTGGAGKSKRSTQAPQGSLEQIGEEIKDWVYKHIIYIGKLEELKSPDRVLKVARGLLYENLDAYPDIKRFGLPTQHVKSYMDTSAKNNWPQEVANKVKEFVEYSETLRNSEKKRLGSQHASPVNPMFSQDESSHALSTGFLISSNVPQNLSSWFSDKNQPPQAPILHDPTITLLPSLQQLESECGFYAAYNAVVMSQAHPQLQNKEAFDLAILKSGEKGLRNWIDDADIQKILNKWDAENILIVTSIENIASLLLRLATTAVQKPEDVKREIGNLGSSYKSLWQFYTGETNELVVIINTTAQIASLDRTIRGSHWIAAKYTRTNGNVTITYADSIATMPGIYNNLLSALRAVLMLQVQIPNVQGNVQEDPVKRQKTGEGMEG